jgi:endonuclease/exonuclease/phosphatase (EEP) superfamily protein YafD
MHEGSDRAVRVGLAVAWVLALAALALTGARWVDVAWSPLALAQSLSPLAAVAAVIAAFGVLLPTGRLSRIALATACALVAVVQAAIWLPWLTDETPRPGRALTVMSVNLFKGRADLAAISSQVRAHGVDVLVLTEVTAEAKTALRAGGVHALLPYAHPADAASGSTVIRSRLRLNPLPDSGRGLGATDTGPNPAARLHLGTDVILRAVHPAPPVSRRISRWQAAHDLLEDWAARTRGPLVVAGDFNASVDHPGMRQLMAGGLRDAHEVAGAGRPPTWPRLRVLPPFVHIDHVLVRGLDVASAREVTIPRTDHAAVIADLVVPARQ